MKKAAILSIAAFYLLLTTGMFVCILHCTTEYFLQPQLAMHDDDHDGHEAYGHGKHKHGCGEGCDCCNKHDNYVIKENIKPGLDFPASQVTIITLYQTLINIDANSPDIYRIAWHKSNAPPGFSGKSIIIKYRSILI
jgi:hypothetical protein